MQSALSRRAFVIGGSVLGMGGSLLSGCGRREGGTAANPVLRVSTVGKGEADVQSMLQAAGIRPDPLHIDYSKFASGHLVVEALNGGALDYGDMSEIPPVFAAASTTHSFRQIAVLHGDVNNQVVLVPKNSAAQGLADLKGLRVGYVRATTSQYFLIRMLESVGLTWGDITPIPMGVADGLAAFSTGKLDAWAIYGFPIQRVIASDGARILKTALGFLSGNYIVCAHVDALADAAKAAAIGGYLRIVKRAFAWSTAHEAVWTTKVAQDIGVPLEYVQDEFRHRSDAYSLRAVDAAAIASQQGVADVFAKQGLIPEHVDVKSLWDDRFNDIILEKG